MRLAALAFVTSLLAGSSFAADEPRVRNVLFIVSDDLKASVLGCYGNELCKTPNLDRLAKRGIVFDRTYCQGLVCGPSRQSFMFSRYPSARLASGPSMAEHFKANGWYSARVGKIYHMRVPGDIIAGTNGQRSRSNPGPSGSTPPAARPTRPAGTRC